MLCRKKLFFFGFLLAFNFLGAKEPNLYSVITLENDTPYRIYYSYRWGEESRNSIPPHSSWVHWWKFDSPNEDWAPLFYLYRDGDEERHQLASFFSPDTEKDHGRIYRFVEKFDNGERKIVLKQRLYRE